MNILKEQIKYYHNKFERKGPENKKKMRFA